MKKNFVSLQFFTAAASLAFAVSGCTTLNQAAASKSTAVKSADLIIAINVPPTWRPFLSDDIAETFSDRLETVFQDRGYTGKMAEQDDFTTPAPGQSLLTIYLDEWRIDHIGNVVCTFRATIQTGSAPARSLGNFSSRQLKMMRGPGRWGLADSFGNAADDALHDLYRQLLRDHLLPSPAAKS